MSAGGLCVALDVRELPRGPSGDRTYMLSLLREYRELAGEWRVVLSYQAAPETGLEGEQLPPNFEIRHVPCRPGWLWTPVAWPRLMRAERADVAHAQYLVPPRAPCPTIVTIHDVSFLRHPEWFPPRPLRIMRRLIPFAARRATRVVTGSQHAADEIAELCHVSRSKIVVIPYGVSEAFRPVPLALAREHVRARYGLDGPYLLAVGLVQPRKNLSRLVDVFALVARAHPDLRLAVVGAHGWGVEAIQQRVAAAGVAERVTLCGPAPDEDLPALYRAARVMVYPSLYEGFGLPPLEAMACGTPVVASATTALPEVVGESGVLVDPLDATAIAEGIRRVLEEPGLAERLSAAGIERAATFTWRRTAQAHLELYRELAEARSGRREARGSVDSYA